MKVLQSMAGAQHGGAEAFFTRLVLALHRAGLEQRVVLRTDAERAEQLMAAGIAPVQLSFGGPLDLATRLRLRREIADFRPDVVLSWMSRAADFCPPSRGRFVHCGRLGGYYNLKYYQRCDRLIGNTKGIVDYLIGEGWPAERAHYLPNFVAADQVAPTSRAELSTPDDATVVLALGRLHANKAFDVLIEAMRGLPNAYLWLAGEGPLAEQLKSRAVHLGVAPRIRFLGWRTAPASLYAAADVVVCPSRIEPLGNVVLEAWARRRPVVAAAAAGPTELIRDGVDGLLVPIDDANALARAVDRVLSNRAAAATLAGNGHDRFLAEFTEDKVVARYLRFFDEVSG
ncbi:MAG: glycosyltransferase [Alphaproteobacteria bacterium]|jgi:glycosyltransferase involved in cell wall biosynthesis|nr:glycosyltransferase [Alphaproteobacteria bacterium]MDP6566511.1 glycosyltransferase [Alphaproteobacteria bacterium]MDP6812791.1 glycosyltransferase [Alphaproteobacteria bacterium]